LVTSLSLYDNPKRKVAVRLVKPKSRDGNYFHVAEGKDIDFDQDQGTVQRGTAACPFCQQTVPSGYIQKESSEGRITQILMAVVERSPESGEKHFRDPNLSDLERYSHSENALLALQKEAGEAIVPTEGITERQPRLMWVTTYGLDRWDKLFNTRQLLALCSFARAIQEAGERIGSHQNGEYRNAVVSFHGLALGRMADYNSTLCRWAQDFVGNTFGRQGLPMVWNYCEAVPVGESAGNWTGAIDWE